MGYYRDYTLTVQNVSQQEFEEIERALGVGTRSALQSWGDFQLEGYDTWGDHENELLDISERYPNAIFTLHGDGGSGDLWYKYFKNGKIQYDEARIEYDGFNERKLQ